MSVCEERGEMDNSVTLAPEGCLDAVAPVRQGI